MVLRLLDGALRRLDRARHENPTGECTSHDAAVVIIGALQESLDLTRGGQLADNLFELYDYMLRRLRESRGRTDTAALGEVASLLETIRDGWQAIAPEAAGAGR